MKLFAKTYFQTLLVVAISMVCYVLIIVPLIEPSKHIVATNLEYQSSLGGVRWWRPLFTEQAWQVDNPTMVQNGRGVLLAKSWEQIGPKTWKLEPLTMILPQSAQDLQQLSPNDQAFGEQDVWIVNAERGAIIDFEEPFDLRSGVVPSVERGQLSGAISITRRAINHPELEPWSLTTSDLSIDRRRISTLQSVTIQWNESVIRGRDLRIMLRRDVLGGSSDDDDDASAWGPLDELELYHLEELDVRLPDGGLWANVDPKLLLNATSLKDLPARLQAKCGGRFAFDFKSSQAAFTNGVKIIHQVGDLPADEFLSHKLSVEVEPPTKDRGMPSQKPMGGISLKAIEALGIDSLQGYVGEQWVDLNSPLLGAVARAKKLSINLKKQRVSLSGKLDQPGSTQSIAWLEYQGHEFRSPLIEYQAAPSGADGKSQHAGWMFAEGPGELSTPADSRIGQTQIRWQDSLKMAPAETPGEQWVELAGNTFVENPNQGFMASERLQIWLKRNSSQDKSAPTPAGTPSSHSMASRYLPDRIVADGKTTLASADIKAQVNSLRMQIVYAPPANAPAEPKGLQLSDSVGNPMYSFVSPPVGSSQSNSTTSAPKFIEPANEAGAARPVAQKNPIIVTGTSLQTTLVSAGNQSWIDALSIAGPVKIEGAPATGSQPFPWTVQGDQLLLATNPAGQVDMQILGQPARVLLADGALEGKSIRFDQLNNLLWMDQPGEFTIPPSVLNQREQDAAPDRNPLASANSLADARPGAAGSLQWLKPPRCQWQGRMLFDGSVVRIEGDIELDGVARQGDELWILKGYCQRLDLVLASPIDLRRGIQPPINPTGETLERIVLQENVDLRVQQRDLSGEPKSLERIVVPILTLHVPSQKVVGGGPGWINSKFVSSGNELGQLASRNATERSAKQLQGAHLVFRDSMVAFLDRKEVVFDGKVQLASGPLPSWNDIIDLNKMSRLERDQMMLNCDQLNVIDTSQLSTTNTVPTGANQTMKLQAMEIQATGNVVFEGNTETGTYSGKGHQVTYVQFKDQLTLRGDGQNPAEFRKTPENPRVEAAWQGYVNEATVNLKTMDITNLQMSQFNVDLAQPGTNSVPGGPSTSIPTRDPRSGVSDFLQPPARPLNP